MGTDTTRNVKVRREVNPVLGYALMWAVVFCAAWLMEYFVLLRRAINPAGVSVRDAAIMFGSLGVASALTLAFGLLVASTVTPRLPVMTPQRRIGGMVMAIILTLPVHRLLLLVLWVLLG
jgi:hypothetical protein